MCDSIPTITQERGGVEVVVWPWVWWVRELIAFWTWGVSMLKRLLSLWMAVAGPVGVSRFSSGQVGPSFEDSWVVARMGMFRICAVGVLVYQWV